MIQVKPRVRTSLHLRAFGVSTLPSAEWLSQIPAGFLVQRVDALGVKLRLFAARGDGCRRETPPLVLPRKSELTKEKWSRDGKGGPLRSRDRRREHRGDTQRQSFASFQRNPIVTHPIERRVSTGSSRPSQALTQSVDFGYGVRSRRLATDLGPPKNLGSLSSRHKVRFLMRRDT